MGQLTTEEIRARYQFHRKVSTLCLELFNHYSGSPYKKIDPVMESFMRQLQVETEIQATRMNTYLIALQNDLAVPDDVYSFRIPDADPVELGNNLIPPKDYEL